MSYQVKTRVFEGPLDLLLQLITSHQVVITELSLSDLVTEYVQHLDLMRKMDMEVTSEFLLIAATLIQLKARHLLPEDLDVDLDEELALAAERDRLLARLLACLTFKDVAAVLRHRFEAQERYVPRRAGLDPDIVVPPPKLRLTVDAIGLATVLERVLARQLAEPDLDHLDLELPSVGAALEELRLRMADQVEADFDSLVTHCTRSLEVVAYFLAMLELARWGVVNLAQESVDAPILVRSNAEQVGDIDGRASEWSTDA